MVWLRRIGLFLIVNFVVMMTISFFLYIFNVQPFLTQQGLDIRTLAIFCLIWGMGGAFISLGMSRMTAKWSLGVQVIDPNTREPQLQFLLQTIRELTQKAGLPMPEVGIYNSPEVNAFATGPSKNRSLVAVSSGLLQRMNEDEASGVLGHEVTHIANGDMVTMTLLQGIINAFVMFLARILAIIISRGMSRDARSSDTPVTLGGSYYMFVFIFEIVFMFLGSMIVAAFSRRREYRADFGGARLAGKENMIAALRKLQRTYEIQDTRAEQPTVQAFKISNPAGLMRLFSTHPPLEDRIARLESLSLR